MAAVAPNAVLTLPLLPKPESSPPLGGGVTQFTKTFVMLALATVPLPFVTVQICNGFVG